jgi:RNA polymerase sigma factor (sigma-70 family)
MDTFVRGEMTRRAKPGGRRSALGGLLARESRPLDAAHVGELLGRWRARELRLAGGFSEWNGLTREQREDIYQETALALLTRRYESAEHLRNALREGLKQRALRQHRDQRRRGQILDEAADELVPSTASQEQSNPDSVLLTREDRLVVAEFLAELDALEQRVFWAIAEGMSYRAISTALGIELNRARNTVRSCERKRERFQLLYDTGRLCGYRALTIRALQDGKATSDHLAQRAFAHLERCAHCRRQHRTNARRLRLHFENQAAALLLPLPAITRRAGRIAAVRALLAGGGAKLAAGAAGVALLAGGAIGLTHPLWHTRPAEPERRLLQAPASPPPPGLAAGMIGASPMPAGRPRRASAAAAPRARKARSEKQREPEGFGYLGVPGSPSSASSEAPRAAGQPSRSASATPASTGGAFSP